MMSVIGTSGEKIDGRIVGRELWRVSRQLLRDAGFDQFTSRGTRRLTPDRIDIVSFQSFNKYIADGVGCTTYSFAVRIGCFYRFVPTGYKVPRKKGELWPEEYHCQIRGTVHKTLRQPECRRKDVWYIDPDGRYLLTIPAEVHSRLQTVALPWFDRFSDLQEVLRTLNEDAETSELHGFGAKGSPARALLLGYFAKRLGNTALAIANLETALRSECYSSIRATLAEDLRLLQAAE